MKIIWLRLTLVQRPACLVEMYAERRRESLAGLRRLTMAKAARYSKVDAANGLRKDCGMRKFILIVAVALAACERPPVPESPPTETASAPATPVATALVEPPPAVADPMVARGEALVAANCLRCHAALPGEKSAHASAPSFATLFTNYPPEYLQEAFAEGVFVGHGDMPAFEFTPSQINDLVAYLKTLGPGPAAN